MDTCGVDGASRVQPGGSPCKKEHQNGCLILFEAENCSKIMGLGFWEGFLPTFRHSHRFEEVVDGEKNDRGSADSGDAYDAYASTVMIIVAG